MASATAVEEALRGVETPPLTLRSIVRSFGPGLILMMTGIGTSHLVTAPAAGGRFGYALLWCIPVAYVFKYSGFEMAFRFTHATGHSLLDAYATAPRAWPLWYVLVTTLVQCVVGQAGRLVAAAAVLYYAATALLGIEIPMGVLALALGVVSVAVHLAGRYSIMEAVTKILAGILVVSALAIYVLEPAPASALRHFFVLATPEGSWLVLAAFLGLLPTGIDVSLQASEWGKARRVGLGLLRPALEKDGLATPFDARRSKKADLAVDHARLPAEARSYCRRWLQLALWDFRLGHLISFLLACLFLLLAAVHLYPSEVAGNAVMGEIGRIFTASAGPWMMGVFLLGAFAATFSTAFNYYDGWPRVVGACCRNLFASTAAQAGLDPRELSPHSKRSWSSEYNIYRATMLFSLVASVVIAAGAPRPVWLVLVASALAFFIAPVIFFLNLYYCFTVIPRDSEFYPSRSSSVFAWVSLVVFTGMTAVLILARVFGITLIGG